MSFNGMIAAFLFGSCVYLRVIPHYKVTSKLKQIYKITYPTGKIYIGKDSVGSHRYFGSPNMDIINTDFETLAKEIKLDYTIRKQILWDSENASEKELSEKEVEFIKHFQSNNPTIGYNQWPKFKNSTK
jgi:hypothetical protein